MVAEHLKLPRVGHALLRAAGDDEYSTTVVRALVHAAVRWDEDVLATTAVVGV